MNNQMYQQTQQQAGFPQMMNIPGMQANPQGQNLGAHEVLMTHEVLTDMIDGINQFQLYQPHITDSQLQNIWSNQIQHMHNSYQNLVNYMHNKGGGQGVPYRTPRQFSPKYGLRNPSPQQPNNSINQMDDRDVASGMLGCAKASACLYTTAALECADPTLRNMVSNCVQSAINQAYELFQYMNQKGMYQVPTLADRTTNTMANTYQPGTSMAMMH